MAADLPEGALKNLVAEFEAYVNLREPLWTRQGPRLSIRIVIGILPSDTETSAVSPCERVRKM